MPPQPETTRPAAAKPRVLIVDESDDSRAVLRDLLERAGATVFEAHDSADAARAAEETAPEAVVFDVDGLAPVGRAYSPGLAVSTEREEADELQAWAARTETPVVAVGTKRATADFPAAREFVRKPYHYPALVHKIQDVLASRRAA